MLLSRRRHSPEVGHGIAHTGGRRPALVPVPFDDSLVSPFSKITSILTRPEARADKAVPRKPARAAIRSVRLGTPAGRIPFRLAFAAGAGSPAAGLALYVRRSPYAPLTPVFRRGWRQSAVIAQPVREVAQVGIPLEWGVANEPPLVAISFPRARTAGEARTFGRLSLVGPPRRFAEPAGAEPMEFLIKGSSLPACAYRTRSMLQARLQEAGRSDCL